MLDKEISWKTNKDDERGGGGFIFSDFSFFLMVGTRSYIRGLEVDVGVRSCSFD